ncbi:MAG: ECF-type sigma factor [Planctomycetota bacterium]
MPRSDDEPPPAPPHGTPPPDAPRSAAPGAAELLDVVYDELRSLASSYLARERSDHTLQPTALVHEAFVRLSPQRKSWSSRGEFLGVAAMAMRRILVDHARGAQRAKRGGEVRRVDLDLETVESDVGAPVDVLRLDEALDRLAALSPRQARVVELRFFGGMTNGEVADVLDVSYRTVENDWRFARAWLRDRMKDSEDEGGDA